MWACFVFDFWSWKQNKRFFCSFNKAWAKKFRSVNELFSQKKWNCEKVAKTNEFEMFSNLILLVLISLTIGRNITIKVGFINSATITRMQEVEMTFAFAEQKIRELRLIDENVKLKYRIIFFNFIFIFLNRFFYQADIRCILPICAILSTTIL